MTIKEFINWNIDRSEDNIIIWDIKKSDEIKLNNKIKNYEILSWELNENNIVLNVSSEKEKKIKVKNDNLWVDEAENLTLIEQIEKASNNYENVRAHKNSNNEIELCLWNGEYDNTDDTAFFRLTKEYEEDGCWW